MSKNASSQQEPVEPFSYHVEPPAQGGQRYIRCNRCGRECIPADPDRLLHKRSCPVGGE